MKSFIVGLVTVLVIGLAGFAVFKNGQNLLTRLTPSPSASVIPSPTIPTISPTPKPSATPSPTYRPTTKGGVVKGATTTTTTKTVTSTSSHLLLTLVKSSTCPISYMTEVKDIAGPLTLKYALKDNFSARLNVWKKDGNELVSNTLVKGSGTLATISNVDYFKLRVESVDCSGDATDWIKVTAER